MNFVESSIVLECQGGANLGRQEIRLSRGPDPLTHGMVSVSGAVPSTGPCLVERGASFDKRGVVGSVQHLSNFEKNLDHMLVTVHLGACLWIERQKEDVHLSSSLFDVSVT